MGIQTKLELKRTQKNSGLKMNTSLRNQNEGRYWTPVNRMESDSNNTRSRMPNLKKQKMPKCQPET